MKATGYKMKRSNNHCQNSNGSRMFDSAISKSEVHTKQTTARRQLRGLLMLSLTFLLSGCTQASLKELPTFWSGKSKESSFKEASFTELSKSETATLTIWHESFEEAQAASRESGKPILADFTGSDWCTWCIKLKNDVFETSEFKKWASENVILVELDYPKRGIQSPAIRRQNAELKDRYAIKGYPTVLLLDSEGERLGKLGYMKSPSDWISKAESFLSKSAKP